MRLFLSALLGAVLFACSSDNPLAERVANLEQELSEMKAAQEEERLSLLARLDALAVTADNADEIVAVRAKLNQTNVTRSEFTRLANRVAALESQMADWSRVVSSLERSVYAVLAALWDDNEVLFFSFIGTGFAVNSETLVTNGHIIDGLRELDDELDAHNRAYGTNLWSDWIVVQNLMTDFRYNENFFSIGYYSYHDQWDSDDLRSPDIGSLTIKEGFISRRATLARSSDVYQLKVGAPIATLGFPGELQADQSENVYPIATFKNGTISALRPRYDGRRYNAPSDTYIVQHNLDLSGGTSGSPVFDASGRVVAINNAGVEFSFDIGGETSRVSQAALGFGIRADKIHEMLNDSGIAAKRTTHTNFSELASRLEGRDINSFNIVTTREEFAERLERMR